MGPKPTADQKVKNCVQLFVHRKGRVKTNSINVRIVESQAGDWCNEANIIVMSAIKQRWCCRGFTYIIYECNEATVVLLRLYIYYL